MVFLMLWDDPQRHGFAGEGPLNRVTEHENNKASQILARALVGEAGGVVGGSRALGLT